MAEFLPSLPGRMSFILQKGQSRLLCFYAGERQLKAIRDSIGKTLPKGVASETLLTQQCTEFKLHDHPLQPHTTGVNIVAVMRLYTNILSRYYRNGWKLVTSAFLSDRRQDDPMLIFRKVVNPSSYPIVSIGISYFHIHLENAPEDLTPIVEQLINTYLKHEVKYIDRESETSTTFKLKGMVGLGDHETHVFVTRLLSVLHKNNYVIYGSIPLHYHVTDMMFFHYTPNLADFNLEEGTAFTMIIKDMKTLKLVQAELPVINAVEETIQLIWENGYQKKDVDGGLELRLKGNPFSYHDDRTVRAEILFAELLKKLALFGFFVSSSFTHLGCEKQINFRKERRERSKVRFLCLNFTNHSIRFVNAPQEIIDATNQLVEEMKIGVKENCTVTVGCSYEVKFKKEGILFDVDGIEAHQGRCLLAALMGSFMELRYHFVMAADLRYCPTDRRHRRHHERCKSWFFMFDEEEVALKQQLKIESLSRSPSPHRGSCQNSPNRSPCHHQHPRNRPNHHPQHRNSPRFSPRVFRSEPSSASFLHSGETHLLPSPLIDVPPSYDEVMSAPPYESVVAPRSP